jgi:hypothetical protein
VAASFICTVFILIHGTWGADATWYVPGGDFFAALERSCTRTGAMAVPFRWSGQNTDAARRAASHALTRLVQSYPPSIRVCIIGHSHGGNVALLASKFFAADITMLQRIDALYLLGTPANSAVYGPNMEVIKYVYNFISFEDIIQPVVGFFAREQPCHERIANVRITINGKEPDHTNLHHEIIGKWLPYLDQLLHSNEKQNFAENIYNTPGIIHFSEHKAPWYSHDNNRIGALERDTHLNQLMLTSIIRSPGSTRLPIRFS